jgi:SAM-dependent methyltransferase
MGSAAHPSQDRPAYTNYRDMDAISSRVGPAFARQALQTCADVLPKPVDQLDVLDIGSGYGHIAAEYARHCRSVVGLEPTREPFEAAQRLAADLPGLSFRHQRVEQLEEVDRYDLIVLDNVYEHLPDQADALDRIDRALRPGGVVYLLMPNRLWPIEAHYLLPFLSWLPLRVASAYLRLTGRGDDYTDASYARTWWTLRRALDRPSWTARFTLPADPTATQLGSPWHYRLGLGLLSRWPMLWCISKSFLVVVKKD